MPLLVFFGMAGSSPALAADRTPPTRPIVTDDGTYTTSTIMLHARWSSSDPQSGISEYQYQIRQDSLSGAILVDWTSTGATAFVTHTGLTLAQGKRYFFCVKAKNGVGLWSATGYSNGIWVDATAPTAPGQPKEGSSWVSPDADYDPDGDYVVSWSASSDPESKIAAYELQEKIGPTGSWTTLTRSSNSWSFYVRGRSHNAQYFYQVRAKNGAGTWSPWSAASDGILVDTTNPTDVTVTDDGAFTNSMTQLHAAWAPSTDPESGIINYDYFIRQDSIFGKVIVSRTSVGMNTEITRTGLRLIQGKKYYIGVQAKNGALRVSSIRYSDGITVDSAGPDFEVTFPQEGTTIGGPGSS